MAWTILQNVDTGIVAIHAALLPTSPEGDILCFGDWAGSGPEGVVHSTLTRIYHVGTETLSPEFAEEDLPDTNGFCGGQAFLSDGRLLLAGGTVGWPEAHVGPHDAHYEGERACWLYLPREQRWTRVRDLRFQPGSNSKGGGRWYPTLVTLPDGQVFAVAGHPAADDDYNGRHNNNTPERYSATSNWWTLMTGITAPNTRENDSYPRYRLLPNGDLFTDTVANGGSDRIMDPYSGSWVAPEVDTSDLPDYYNLGSAATSVLLPLQPPAYRPRILACNSPDDTAFRIDVAGSPEWDGTPDRQSSMQGANRENGCAVLLPTGQVLLCGGWPRGTNENPLDDDIANATLLPELYTPGIDWGTGEFSEDEEWVTLDDSEASEIGRGYHSVALLLPDGRVWAAGSTTALVGAERRIDIYSPSYVGQTRPTVQSAPTNVGYGRVFNVTVGNGNQIQRVALIRCGSVTHGFNSDQRYVGLAFSQNGNTLTITAPPNGMIAPPGYYMLWVVTSNNRPCELAPFIRLSNQQALLYVDRSTFSVHEVDALGLPAHFYYAFYFILDGFLPHEVGEPIEPPDIVFEYSNGDPVPDMHFELATTKWEDPTTPPDTAQRLTFACHIRFDSQEAFDQITGDSDNIILRATHGVFSATANLVLSTNPNPWMRDGDVPWLSTDVRVFQVQPGMLMAGVSHGSGSDAPYDFIQNLLDEFNSLPPTEDHPFFEIAEDPDESQLSFAGEAANGQPVYNYAVAKVRMTGLPEVTAEGVGVFFRLFTTSATGFEYNTSASYDREGSGADSYPVLGRVGGDIATIPFFAEARADEGDPQSDSTNRKDIKGGGAQAVHTYFGCWLDINQETPEFEEDGEMKSVQEILKGEHQCLVAELNYDLDPIPPNTTPGSNENLSQRNLVITAAPNPASLTTRVVAHTVEIAPSKTPAQLPPNLGPGASSTAARMTPDELVFSWRNIPTDTQVTLYLPDVDVEHVLALAARRQGPAMVERVDAHTLRLKVGGITYVPLPGGRTKNIPALLTMQLPPNLVKGTIYKATIKQFEGQRRRVLGTIQLKIPITTAEAILPEEIRKLAVFRHIASKLKNTNKWYPIFERYLGLIEDRVRGFGANPDEVLPSPTGNPPRHPLPRPERERETGKVTEILYDCFGGFEGFVLATCDGHKRFKACERGIEEIVWKACKERSKVTILIDHGIDDRLLKIVVHCC